MSYTTLQIERAGQVATVWMNRPELHNAMNEHLIGDLTAVPQPIEIKLFGDDPAVLEQAARRVATRIGRIHGVVEVVDGLRVAGDAIVVRVQPGIARQYGLDPATVATTVVAEGRTS